MSPYSDTRGTMRSLNIFCSTNSNQHRYSLTWIVTILPCSRRVVAPLYNCQISAVSSHQKSGWPKLPLQGFRFSSGPWQVSAGIDKRVSVLFTGMYRWMSTISSRSSSISIRDEAGFRNVVMKMIGGLRNWSRLRAASINIIIVYSESN